MNHVTTTVLEKMPKPTSFSLLENSILKRSFYEARLAYLLAQGVFGVESECSRDIASPSPLEDLAAEESSDGNANENAEGDTTHDPEESHTNISCLLPLPRTIRRMPKLRISIPEIVPNTATTVTPQKRVSFVDEPIDFLKKTIPAKRVVSLSVPPKSAIKKASPAKPIEVIPTPLELGFEIDEEGNPMFAGEKINFVERMIDQLEELQKKQIQIIEFDIEN